VASDRVNKKRIGLNLLVKSSFERLVDAFATGGLPD
jgi:hypothetical protein